MKLNKLLFLLAAFFLGAKLTMADVAEGEKLFNASLSFRKLFIKEIFNFLD